MSKGKKHSKEYFTEARDFWWNDDYLNLLAERLNLKSCSTLVDIGCGEGHMSFKLAPYLKQKALVVGIDFEDEHVNKAKKEALKKNNQGITFRFQKGDVYNLPLEDSISDITVCQTLLIHLEDPLKAIMEMKRITKSEGKIIAIEPNNIVNTLIADSIYPIDDIEERLQKVEMQMRIEEGKKKSKKGFNSLGDKLPELFIKSKLKDIKVWLNDKSLAIIPPYDIKEKRMRIKELLRWMEKEESFYDYDQELKYYLSGGGKKEKFDKYWKKLLKDKETIKQAIKDKKYIFSGGNLTYIVVGKK